MVYSNVKAILKINDKFLFENVIIIKYNNRVIPY